MLQFVADGEPRDIVRMRLRTTVLGPIDIDGRELAAFRAVVEDVRVDRVTYADVRTGMQYVLKDEPTVVGRWRRQVELLQAAGTTH